MFSESIGRSLAQVTTNAHSDSMPITVECHTCARCEIAVGVRAIAGVGWVCRDCDVDGLDEPVWMAADLATEAELNFDSSDEGPE